MRTFFCAVIIVVFSVNAFAQDDITIIYRKADKMVVGRVVPPHSVKVEIKNILRSELGGAEGDYATATIEKIPVGHIAEINASGKVITKADPKTEAKKQTRATAIAKLIALGLTRAEIESLK